MNLPTTPMEMVAWLTIAGVIVGVVQSIVKFIISKFVHPVRENDREIDALKAWNRHQQEDIDSQSELGMINLKVNRTILEVVSGQNCNGNVKEAMTSIDGYLMKHAGKQHSRMRHEEENE